MHISNRSIFFKKQINILEKTEGNFFLQEPFVNIPEEIIREALKVVLGIKPAKLTKALHPQIILHDVWEKESQIWLFFFICIQTSGITRCLSIVKEERYNFFSKWLSFFTFNARTLSANTFIWIYIYIYMYIYPSIVLDV